MQPFPLVLGRSPPLTHPGFRRPLARSLPPTVPGTPRRSRAALIAAATAPTDALRGSRVRAQYLHLPAFTPNPAAVDGLSPYEVPKLGVPRHSRASRSPGGVLSEGRELHPPLFGLAIVGPPVGRVGARAGLPPRAYALTGASPPAAAARVTGLWVRPIPRGGFAPPFPRSAPRVRP